MAGNAHFTKLGVPDYNQAFLDALEFVDDVIQQRQHMKVSVWRSMVGRSAYTLGEGLVKKSYRFHPGLGDQRGLQRWRPIQISRVAAGDDPGVDACAYNPYLVDYGFETVNYTGLQTERRTKHICIKDIRFTWEFRQQLGLIMNFLGDISNSVWENFAREQYIKFAVDGGNGYVMSTGAPNQHNFTYDPFSTDADGDNVITIDQDIAVSTLDWSYMRWWSRWLQMQAPMSAIGSENGRPLFGMVFDLEDFDKMIENDAALREDYRYHMPSVLINNYGTVQMYKGFSLMHDVAAPRFMVKSSDGTTVTLKRVDPLLDTEAVTIGNKVNVNPDYLNAEFALGVVFMKDVYKIEIPPAGPSSPGGSTSFGATPSLNGEFKWLNIQDEDTNPLNEVGFYFSRFEGFPKPLGYEDDCIVFLYRRCPNTEPQECGIGGDDAVATETGLESNAAAGDIDTDNNTITLTLSSIIDCEAPAEVTLKDNDANTDTAIIADSSQAPTYTFALPDFDTVSNSAAKYTAAGAASVICL